MFEKETLFQHEAKYVQSLGVIGGLSSESSASRETQSTQTCLTRLRWATEKLMGGILSKLSPPMTPTLCMCFASANWGTNPTDSLHFLESKKRRLCHSTTAKGEYVA